MTESGRHTGFKHLVENILIELQDSGMKLEDINEETKKKLYKEKRTFTALYHLKKLRRFDINNSSIQVYLAWTKNNEIDEEDICINNIKYESEEYQGFTYYNTEYNKSKKF